MSKPIQIFSEIEPLKRVMLHRPGAELENLMPDYLEDCCLTIFHFWHKPNKNMIFLQKF